MIDLTARHALHHMAEWMLTSLRPVAQPVLVEAIDLELARRARIAQLQTARDILERGMFAGTVPADMRARLAERIARTDAAIADLSAPPSLELDEAERVGPISLPDIGGDR